MPCMGIRRGRKGEYIVLSLFSVIDMHSSIQYHNNRVVRILQVENGVAPRFIIFIFCKDGRETIYSKVHQKNSPGHHRSMFNPAHFQRSDSDEGCGAGLEETLRTDFPVNPYLLQLNGFSRFR
ncbi:hypothetical protein POM88_044045 [Heracleum sosnowskyi]|uniref:Uncharacterized protein n=1 Tax=Heracleum sosnowskyi TaxID=360622 RepID=A0AAD8H317_9APIA|nr:hypothetical protein POM88_044045 [Heracleum sosnowskyi]